jgi:hypothetical protein
VLEELEPEALDELEELEELDEAPPVPPVPDEEVLVGEEPPPVPEELPAGDSASPHPRRTTEAIGSSRWAAESKERRVTCMEGSRVRS